MSELDDLLEEYKVYPHRVKLPIEMTEPNADIPIYHGKFRLKKNGKELDVDGEIKFAWFPTPRTVFEGKVLSNTKDPNAFEVEMDLIIDGLFVGSATTYYNISLTETRASGEFIHFIYGDKSVNVDRVVFGIPNMRDHGGSVIKDISPTRISAYAGRLTLANEKHEIHFDKLPDFKDLQKRLEDKGGYLLLYTGEVCFNKKTFCYTDLSDFLSCLNHFLFFLNGRRYPVYFLSGMSQDERIWTDYGSYVVEMNQYVPSWSNVFSANDFSRIWHKLLILWKEAKDRNFLETAIHWYIEANGQAAYVDGSIIFAQAALELIYNWLLVEKKKIIVGQDADSLSASNKIRLLLAHIQVTLEIPPKYTDLSSLSEAIDGPNIFVYIRNALVHGQEKKRVGLMAISDLAKYQALQLGLWYIELLLLYILDFEGKYYDRTAEYTIAKVGVKVPWSAEKR